jgi:hypothetical protein
MPTMEPDCRLTIVREMEDWAVARVEIISRPFEDRAKAERWLEQHRRWYEPGCCGCGSAVTRPDDSWEAYSVGSLGPDWMHKRCMEKFDAGRNKRIIRDEDDLLPWEEARSDNSDVPHDDYFGLCPICHKTDGYANAGRSHTFYCKEHKKSWLIGSNLLDSWRVQTIEEQLKIWDEIGLEEFEDVEPYFYPRQKQTRALGTAQKETNTDDNDDDWPPF